jgi:hypothetical protein
MRTLLTVVMFFGLLIVADILVNDGNVAEPLWKLAVRTIR